MRAYAGRGAPGRGRGGRPVGGPAGAGPPSTPALTGRRITIRQRAIPYQAEYDGESGGDLEEGAPLSDSEATEIGSDAGE